MLKKLYSLILVIIIAGTALAVQAASLKDAFPQGGYIEEVGERGGYDVRQRSVEPVIGQIISVALSFLGVLFVVLMVYGGYLWMTAAGNEDQVKKAMQLIVAGVIGLIIVVGAYAITVFVMARFTTDLIKQ